MEYLGETYQVYVRGFGNDTNLDEEFGLSGKGKVFNVIVSDVIPTIAPLFTEFPSSFTYKIDAVDGANSEHIKAIAIAEDEDGEIVEMTVTLDEGVDFITYTVEGNLVNFDIKLDEETPVGTYTVKVVATDNVGASITQTFQVIVKQVGVFYEPTVEEDFVFDYTLKNSTESDSEI